MKISCESNRLAEKFLADAYEKVIPVTKYPIHSERKTKNSIKQDTTLRNLEIL